MTMEIVREDHGEHCPCSYCCAIGQRVHHMLKEMDSDGEVKKIFNINPPRRFILIRHKDITGISGTGHVANGVQFSDGTVVMRWLGQNATTVIHKSMATVLALHVAGHGPGNNEIVWVDE